MVIEVWLVDMMIEIFIYKERILMMQGREVWNLTDTVILLLSLALYDFVISKYILFRFGPAIHPTFKIFSSFLVDCEVVSSQLLIVFKRFEIQVLIRTTRFHLDNFQTLSPTAS